MIKIFHSATLWVALFALPTGVFAHQLDEYLQGTLVDIEPGGIRLQMNLTPGVAVADRVVGLIDLNRDGVISTNESAAYAEAVKRDLVVRLDGREVELKLTGLNVSEPTELRTGWGIIQLEYSVVSDALVRGPHKLTLENRHLPIASVYLFNAAKPESPAIQISAQTRNENQSRGEIAFDFQPPQSHSVTGGIVVSLTALIAVVFAGAWEIGKKREVKV